MLVIGMLFKIGGWLWYFVDLETLMESIIFIIYYNLILVNGCIVGNEPILYLPTSICQMYVNLFLYKIKLL